MKQLVSRLGVIALSAGVANAVDVQLGTVEAVKGQEISVTYQVPPKLVGDQVLMIYGPGTLRKASTHQTGGERESDFCR